MPLHQILDLASPVNREFDDEETNREDEQQKDSGNFNHWLELEDNKEKRWDEVEESGNGIGTDEESPPELFQPSSPLQINKNFLLPDIMEESENEQSESLKSSMLSLDGTLIKSPSRQEFTKFDPFEETGLDVVETNFDNDLPLPIHDNVEDLNAPGSPAEPPILPVSPPPGPLLSPRHSMMLLESSAQDNEHSRFSVVSTSSEIAPPFPISPPPGRLIPRESLYLDPESKIDLWYELNKTNGLDEKFYSTGLKSQEGLRNDPILKTDEAGTESLHKLIEHLTSDSGFPDTDQSARRSIENPVNSSHNQPVSASMKNSSTSITSYSDERTTEYSGSIGVKTNASTGSQVGKTKPSSHL